jgi:hypothetical protein
MVFGNGAAGAADFIVMMDTAPLGALSDVADSARQAGEASVVTGEHRGFAYTRAGVSFATAALMFEAPIRGFANDAIANSSPRTVIGQGSSPNIYNLVNNGRTGGFSYPRNALLSPMTGEWGGSLPSENSTVWTVGRHGDMPSPRPSGTQSHHGVNSVWMEANVPSYSAADAPAILMQNDPFHNATRGLFNRVRSEIAARQGVSPRNIDWSQVPPGTVWRLAEEQLQAAQVPVNIQAEYFLQFNQYLDSLR